VGRHPDLLIHPRLRGVSARAVEAYRQVGGEHTLAEEGDGDASPASFAPTPTTRWNAPCA
jgi:hypothetical protein